MSGRFTGTKSMHRSLHHQLLHHMYALSKASSLPWHWKALQVNSCPEGAAQEVLSDSVTEERHTQLHACLTFHPDPVLFGVSTQLRSNFVWHATSSFFAFAVGSSIIVEDLETRSRQTLKHHQTSVGALCLSEDGLLLASASSGVELSGCADICIWHCASKRLAALLQHHTSGIQARSSWC